MYGPPYPPPWWGFPGQQQADPNMMERAFKIVERLEKKEEKKKKAEEEKKKAGPKPQTWTTAQMLSMMVLVGPWIGFINVGLVYMVFRIMSGMLFAK